jgi:spore coat polysaccharide biosynthesis protein SpsF
MLPAVNKPLLQHLVERLQRSRSIEGVIVATTVNATDEPIAELCEKIGVQCFRGSEDDVLARVLQCARANSVETIVEITGDCPLIDHTIADQLVALYLESRCDYASNVLRRTFPRGLDTQVFSTAVLQRVDTLTDHPLDREHVSLYIYKHPQLFSLVGLEAAPELARPEYRWTLDTEEDYTLIRTIFEQLYPENPCFTYQDVYKLLDAQPHLVEINREIKQKVVHYYE